MTACRSTASRSSVVAVVVADDVAVVDDVAPPAPSPASSSPPQLASSRPSARPVAATGRGVMLRDVVVRGGAAACLPACDTGPSWLRGGLSSGGEPLLVPSPDGFLT